VIAKQGEFSRSETKLLRSKLFWVGVLYFAEGFPLGIFYDVFPVYFRQQGIELRQIGLLSLLGLGWTLKFLWAPAVDHYRHHRLWMFSVDLAMGALMLWFAITAGFGMWVWIAIGVFTVLSATNDIAIDGYTIEFLDKEELGLANGVRIGLYRIGVLASGFLLVASDYLQWRGAFITAAIIFCLCAAMSLLAPRERFLARETTLSFAAELRNLVRQPYALAAVLLFLLGTIWLINRETKWSALHENFWTIAFLTAFLLWAIPLAFRSRAPAQARAELSEGPMFGALIEMLSRPYIVPVIVFVLIFKLADSAMGFMIKPFWVDAGFSATEIGLVSVNIGLILSIAGGLAGGWFTDRVGIFTSLWILGLAQAFSNLGYWIAASVLPLDPQGPIPQQHQAVIYTASALESFTGGLGTAAFLAFLMAIVDKKHAATEYALLSSVFALSRSFSGWAGGLGAQAMGYAPYFLLTFFLAFPAYLLLPWVKKMMRYTDERQR
jgi:PAT family beta-lactamase induction signal transducer AmpG